ncbi:MAG: RDD family protein [Acidobacteriota bacterium]
MSERRDDPWLFDLPMRGEDGDDAPPPEPPEAQAPQSATGESDLAEASPLEIEPIELEAPPARGFEPEAPVPEAPVPEAPPAMTAADRLALEELEELPLFPEDSPAALSEDELFAAPAGPAESATVPAEAEPALSYPAPAPAAPSEPVAAPLRARLIAVVADALLLSTVLAVCLLGSAFLGGPTDVWRHGLAFAAFLTVFSFVYSVVSLAFWGQTPGMVLAGVVARAGRDQPLTFGQTGLRWLAGWMTVALGGLPLLFVLTGRSLADRLSGSDTFEAQ